MITHPSLRPVARSHRAPRIDAFAPFAASLTRSLLLVCSLCVAFVPFAHADLRDYTVRWLPSPSAGVDGYELLVVGGGVTSTFDLGHPSQTNGELRYTMELEDSIDISLRMRAYGGGVKSIYSNEIVVAAVQQPGGSPDFGVSTIDGASGVVSGEIVVVAETFGATESVQFLLDGVSYRIESARPYSIQGDGGEPGTENPLDTRLLADGEHTITAVGFSEDSAAGARGASVSVTFHVDNSVAPPPDPTPDPDPDPQPPVGPEGAIAGLFSTTAGDIVALHVNGATTVLANHALARAGDMRAAWCRLDGDADRDLVLGFGPGSNAALLLLHLEDLAVTRVRQIAGAPAELRGDTGETFPACGDIDGDGREEIAVGLGAGTLASIRLLDDYARGFEAIEPDGRDLLRTLPASIAFGDACEGYLDQTGIIGSEDLVAVINSLNTDDAGLDVDCTGMVGASDLAYMLNRQNKSSSLSSDYGRDGAARPVLADVDGDGRDEIIVGRSQGGGGTITILDDALAGFAPVAGLQPAYGVLLAVPDAAYRRLNGATAVAAGDIDGDGLAEILVGAGSGGGGRLYVYDDVGHGFAPMAGSAKGLVFGFAGYDEANGRIEPTLADIDQDGLLEIGLGLGQGGEDLIQLLDDLETGFAPLVWTGDAEGLVRAPAGSGVVTSGIQPGL